MRNASPSKREEDQQLASLLLLARDKQGWGGTRAMRATMGLGNGGSGDGQRRELPKPGVRFHQTTLFTVSFHTSQWWEEIDLPSREEKRIRRQAESLLGS